MLTPSISPYLLMLTPSFSPYLLMLPPSISSYPLMLTPYPRSVLSVGSGTAWVAAGHPSGSHLWRIQSSTRASWT